VLLVVAACEVVSVGSARPTDSVGDLLLNNNTPLQVTVFVNGKQIGDVGAGQVRWPVSTLPQLPWQVIVTTRSGRLLITLPVKAGDVVGTGKGDGIRAELSCGQIDLWVGPPLLGPAPGPGTPGNCAP
jgi:hypothetical protein